MASSLFYGGLFNYHITPSLLFFQNLPTL